MSIRKPGYYRVNHVTSDGKDDWGIAELTVFGNWFIPGTESRVSESLFKHIDEHPLDLQQPRHITMTFDVINTEAYRRSHSEGFALGLETAATMIDTLPKHWDVRGIIRMTAEHIIKGLRR